MMKKSVLMRALVGAVLAASILAMASQAEDAKPTYRIAVDGLACPFCAYGIEKQVLAIEGVQTVETDIESGNISVTMQPGSSLDEEAARMAVEAAGFTLRDFQGQGEGE